MSDFPPNPINSLGSIRDYNNDNHIAKKSRRTYGDTRKRVVLEKVVYFVLASDNLVKIGYTTNVKKRMTAFTILHPNFKLLGIVSNKTEKEVHAIFEPFKVKGEWYRYDESMIEFISIMNINTKF